ncbi:hypothetical protein [Acidiphilium acidophilum]|uniref:hypothetical protein n=1 Tax=Acidiphilium acidophilum TaxID=76588 RepID=UPI002E8E7470|nr:hypothetical protein [Acidiphilium acidophilum]
MTDPHEALADLARRVQRLAPDRRDPERYHAEKSEIAAELRRIARNAEPPRKIIMNNTGRRWTV